MSLFELKTQSLRRRLLMLVSVASLLTWGIAGIVSYRQARNDVQELMDGHMAQAVMLLLAQAERTVVMPIDLSAEAVKLQGMQKSRIKSMLEFAIFGSDGRLLTRSRHGPETLPPGLPGYANIRYRDETWRRLLAVSRNGDYHIWVAQSVRVRDREALEIATHTVLPLGLFFPVLLGLIYFSVRRGLKPLDDIAGEMSIRSLDNLEAVIVARAPLEVQPLVEALNHLLSRLGMAIDHERRFTADAAHELRTPLAAIRVQAQVALASTDSEQHRHALHQVLAGTQRATRLVEQLLRLARLDPIARLPEPCPVDLVAVAANIHTETTAAIPERVEDLVLEVSPDAIVVPGDPDLLAVALRNLVDNAIKYTEAGCRIALYTRIDETGGVSLGVRDAGAGVSQEDLPRLVERFYRGKDAITEGCGLGLAIVRRIAELHGARFDAGNLPDGGFCARLLWSRYGPDT